MRIDASNSYRLSGFLAVFLGIAALLALSCGGSGERVMESNREFDRLLRIAKESPEELRTVWIIFPNEITLDDVYLVMNGVVVSPELEGRRYRHDYGKYCWCYMIYTDGDAEVTGRMVIEGKNHEFVIPRDAGSYWNIRVIKEGEGYRLSGAPRLQGANF